MTTLDATEVRVAITGQLYRAPLGTAAPTTSTSVLHADYLGLGYFNEDGLAEAHSDSVTNIVAWQNATTVRSARTESTTTIAFTPIQSNAAVLETFHPGSQMGEPTAGNFRIDVLPPIAAPCAWVFDAVDGTKHMRFYLGNAEVTERGEIQYQNGNPIGYPMTVTAYPDASGRIMIKFSDDANWGEGVAGS